MLPPQACVDIPPRSPGLEAPRRLFRGRGKRREALEQRPPPGEALAAAPCEDLQAAAGPSLGWRQGQGGARLAVKEGEGTGAKVSPKPWSPAIWLKRWPPCAHVLSFPAGTGAAVRSEHWPPEPLQAARPALWPAAWKTTRGPGPWPAVTQSGSQGGRHMSLEGTAGERPAGRCWCCHSEGGRGRGWMPDPGGSTRGDQQRTPGQGFRAPDLHGQRRVRRPHLPELGPAVPGPRPPTPPAAPGSDEELFACGPSAAPRQNKAQAGHALRSRPRSPRRPPSPGPPHPTGCRASTGSLRRWAVSRTKSVCKLV